MPWKRDEDGNFVAAAGDGEEEHPVWVKADGTEEPFNPERPLAKISELNRENAKRREAAEKLQAQLEEAKPLQEELESWRELGVENPDQARELIEAARKGVDGADIAKIREQVASSFESKITNIKKELDAAREEAEATKARMAKAAISAQFASSPWFSGESPKSYLPPDVAAATFGAYFRHEDDGTVAGYEDPGTFEKRILISEGDRVGEPAGFNDAIAYLMNRREDKDRLLAGSGASGSGAPSNGHPRGSGGGKTIPRSEFDSLPPFKQGELVRSGVQPVDG